MEALKFALLILMLREIIQVYVIKVEYFKGEKGVILFFLSSLLFFFLALYYKGQKMADLFGVLSALNLFAIFDYYKQVKRVYRGEFPMNPEREKEMKKIEESLEE